MYNEDTELIFPSRIISQLPEERGEHWKELVTKVSELEQTNIEHLAFILMMVRINGCISCNSDSFRAMRGCTQCTMVNIRRYKGDDESLLRRYNKAQKDLEFKRNK